MKEWRLFNFDILIQSFKQTYKGLIILAIIFFITNIMYFTFLMVQKSENANNLILEHIEEYRDIDITVLCDISDCSYISYNSFSFKSNNTLELIPSLKTYTKILDITDNTYLSYSNIVFNYTYNNIELNIIIPINKSIRVFTIWLLISLVFFLVVVFYLLTFVLNESKMDKLKAINNSESELSNKIMTLLTENIHHELNTPMEVIINKNIKLLEYCENNSTYNRRKSDEDYDELMNDFKMIELSQDVVMSVLSKMRNYKNMKHSNGNKTVYDIIKTSSSMLELFHNNYTVNIDKSFKNFRVNHQILRNADLLNIIINHLKNSIDAHSTIINIDIHKYNEKFLQFIISDNGNGVKENIKANIFKENISSKNSENSTRGNGLFLNKELLNQSGGDVKLVRTSTRGTIFLLQIRSDYISCDIDEKDNREC